MARAARGASAGDTAAGSLRAGRETFRYDGLRDEVRVLDGGAPARGTRPRGAAPASGGAGRSAAPSLIAGGRRQRGASAGARSTRHDAGEAAAEDYLERTRARRGARDEGVEDEPPAKRGLAGRLSKARRNASKAKADREFTRRYGDDKPSAAEAGPRAAVYETQMGRQHKRAARMQGDGPSRSSASGPRPSDKREGASSRSRWATLGAVAACLVLTCVFLYPPAQQYYQELRERDRLQAEYAAIQQRNDAIQREVDYLSGDAGVEDKARSEFGWVKAGERSVSVSGIDVQKESNFTANIVPGEVPAPDTWYSFLDPLFGVE
ncbi:FtsB family cell division protein [Adlercreutzia faecimuris]|uniref:Septum formation initiator family protein n=1 Tax=Adlercreutzia faecimuris TaxID=2897341 RepID=A0ABS9WK59_9ACTN|nr:septum formation initiator family protein [Adlercreutzia sp. JBNU-10]